MSRKRIAFLVGQPDELFQSQFIEGFLGEAFENGFDVCVFAMYQKFQESERRANGDSSIFSLIEFPSFDAVIIMADTIQTPGVISRIEERLLDGYSGEVLFVDRRSEHFPSVFYPHYEPMGILVSHLIEEHGLTDIAFLAGKQWHFHTTQRLDAYLEAMNAHGLEVREDRIFYGDFWYTGGENYVDHLLSDPDDMPQAIACANDYMAIGVAEALTKHGYRVPEDIAIVGYDSVREGWESPKPITSIPIEAKAFGVFSAECLIRLVNDPVSDEDSEIFEFSPEYHMFRGASCGCHNESIIPRAVVRESWSTEMSMRSMYSSYNRLYEDMLSRTDFRGVMDTVQSYTFQMRPFHSFNIVLNSNWIEADGFEGTNSERHEYSSGMVNILSCGEEGEGEDILQFSDTFDIKEMLPGIRVESGMPMAYFFLPLFFEDLVFGYAQISYGSEIKCVGEAQFLWLRNVMLGLECIRRQEFLKVKSEEIKIQQYKDKMTGLFNYEGFVAHSRPMIERARSMGAYIGVLAIDLLELSAINQKYGRKEGDKAIIAVAEMLSRASGEGGLCCRLGNDEFVVAQITGVYNTGVIDDIRARIDTFLEEFNGTHDYSIKIASGGRVERLLNQIDMEKLVNAAVSHKNGNKSRGQRLNMGKRLTEEQLKQAEIVERLLDENKFKYHFQPIINAKNGKIFAYEALMRPDVDPYIGPQTILEYAEHLGRITDVERSTFFNVLKYVEENPSAFEGKKVFINSIPGVHLNDDDMLVLNDKLRFYSDQIVIELTERSEADDKTLSHIKTTFRQLGVQSAVDDYGTGYSNVVNLLNYMPDYVKIDRMLLSGIHENPQKQHFVREIVNFAHENNFLVLSEGVETSAEMRTCIELGTDLIQGYYTGRPCAEIITEISPDVCEEIFRYNARMGNVV